jgi:hypothetical protein
LRISEGSGEPGSGRSQNESTKEEEEEESWRLVFLQKGLYHWEVQGGSWERGLTGRYQREVKIQTKGKDPGLESGRMNFDEI